MIWHQYIISYSNPRQCCLSYWRSWDLLWGSVLPLQTRKPELIRELEQDLEGVGHLRFLQSLHFLMFLMVILYSISLRARALRHLAGYPIAQTEVFNLLSCKSIATVKLNQMVTFGYHICFIFVGWFWSLWHIIWFFISWWVIRVREIWLKVSVWIFYWLEQPKLELV